MLFALVAFLPKKLSRLHLFGALALLVTASDTAEKSTAKVIN
jgi:hypothetical protein